MKRKSILIVLIFLITSCQSHLKREDALAMIRKYHNFPNEITYEIPKGYIKDVHTQGRGVTAIIGEDEFKEKELAIESFKDNNLLKLIETSERQETTQFLIGTTIRTWTSVKVQLTNEGSKYLKQEQSDKYLVKLWDIDVLEVTGIQETSKKNATVEFSTHQTNITPFGKLFDSGNKISNNSQNFSLYDDGWRINK